MAVSVLLRDVIEIPDHAGAEDYVLRLTDSVDDDAVAQTLSDYVVTPALVDAFDTALGLVAAVPAVVIYNMFSRSIAGYRALFADGAAEVLRLVSRDLDREEVEPAAKARRHVPLPAAE